MKKNKILYLILGIVLLIIIICSIILIKNHKKELTCKTQNSYITMKFIKNKLESLEGEIIISENSEMIITEINDNSYKYDHLLVLSKDGKKITYSFDYVDGNQAALSYIGLNYGDSIKYKDLKRSFEAKKYKCK